MIDRHAIKASRVPVSSSPIKREKPTTSAATIVVSFRSTADIFSPLHGWRQAANPPIGILLRRILISSGGGQGRSHRRPRRGDRRNGNLLVRRTAAARPSWWRCRHNQERDRAAAGEHRLYPGPLQPP